jgi:hypothetical protein
MADRKISELNGLAEAGIKAADVAPVADISANQTKKVTIPDLAQAGIRLMPDGSINGSKLENGSVDTDQLANGSVTGGTNGKIALDTITADNIAPNAIGSSELADGAVDEAALQNNACTLNKLDANAFGRGLDKNADNIGITNNPGAGTQAGISWDAQGLITGAVDPVPPEDLPLATATTVGAVSVPANGGLSVTGVGALSIDNTVAAATHTKITYDENGLVSSGTGLAPADLPIATSSTLGAVIVPSSSPLEIDGAGNLEHDESGVTAGTYPKVGVDKFGHVIAGSPLEAGDIPNISADKIEGGTLNPNVLGPCSVDGANICDYATCFMQETQPTGEFLGQLWFTPSTAQLRIYSRGSDGFLWLSVGFGNLQQNNLRWLGTYNADADTVISVTSIGVSEGITAGQSFPAPSDSLSGGYFVCQTGGDNMTQNDLQGQTHSAGDWALCLDAAQGWIHIDAAQSGGGGGGGATYLNDLLDVEIGGASSPFATAPRAALVGDNILRFDGTSGLWRNTDIIDGGSID